jgi:hypothetical protein
LTFRIFVLVDWDRNLAIEPKSFRETNLVLEGLEARLGLIQKLTWYVIGLLGALIAGAAALYFQLGDIRTDVAVLKANFGSLKEQQSEIQQSLRSIDSKTQTSLSRIENKLTPAAPAPVPLATPLPGPEETPLRLGGDEIALLREMLKPTKLNKAQARVGDFVPDA